jgi:hypothetical protein
MMRILTWESGKQFAVSHVAGADLDLLQLIQHVKLCKVESSIAIDQMRVSHLNEIEPAAASSPAGSDAPFGSDFLQMMTDVLRYDHD